MIIHLKLFDKNKKNKENENNDKIDNKNEIKNEENENIKEDENDNVMNKEKEIDNINKYQKIKIPHPNVGSVSFPTFMKKGTGNFRIQTPKSKQQNKKILSKSNSNEKEQNNNSNLINKDNYEKENKYSVLDCQFFIIIVPNNNI